VRMPPTHTFGILSLSCLLRLESTPPTCKSQPLISVSLATFGSTSSALPIHKTLLHRMRTWPSVPELVPSMNSSVSESWMFIYRSTEISLPLYSVSPHFRRTTISLSTLPRVSLGCTGKGKGERCKVKAAYHIQALE
jgi:hypothetical protein